MLFCCWLFFSVLSRNPIREIGDSLVKVKSITKLSLSNCQLQNIGSSFMSLADLKEVRLAHNEITTVPVELAHNIRLQNLDMGNNYISNWSDLKVLSSLQNLKNLNLQGNPIAQNDKLAKKVKKLVPNLQIFNSRPIERGKENEKNFKKDVKGHKADDSSPNKASDLKDPKEVRKEYPSNEKISRKRISSQSKDDPLDNGTDSDMEREELKQKKSKTNKLPKKNVTGGNKDDDELENRSNRKNPKKVEETKLDMIDDGETPFMDLIISSSTENTRDGNKTKMGVEADAFVTFPVKKKKKSKSVRMSSAALQLLSSTADVGTGGPSTWDA
ncbi:Leucine-rich repeat [Macleaya cordata]|uniref:Leucine-rich repeat n=1 Tax=Macleaya cordata TaxID=56857 RepID=A0A200PPQ6_MACCD|nr:Leucine-rich repeat [Macleaya cordata]